MTNMLDSHRWHQLLILFLLTMVMGTEKVIELLDGDDLAFGKTFAI